MAPAAHDAGMYEFMLPILYVADIERSAALYRDAFGMRETYRFPREGVPEHVELRLGEVTLGISTDKGLASHHMPASTPGHPCELAFGCADADAALAQLLAAGCTHLSGPFDSPAGRRVAYVADFDGNWISVSSPLPRA